MDEQPNLIPTDDDLVLRAWDGDESVQGDLVVKYSMALETAISHRLPGRLKAYAEDVVAETIRRFWQSKEKFDPGQELGAYLYRIARNLANDLASGHLAWQIARNLEVTVDDECLGNIQSESHESAHELDAVEKRQTGICKAMAESLDTLNPIERDVIEAFGFAGDYEVNAGVLGIELGKIHKEGVPIPAGTIGQHKFRAKNKLIAEMRKRGFEIEKPGKHQ